MSTEEALVRYPPLPPPTLFNDCHSVSECQDRSWIKFDYTNDPYTSAHSVSSLETTTTMTTSRNTHVNLRDMPVFFLLLTGGGLDNIGGQRANGACR